MKEIGLEERKKLQLDIMKDVDAFCRAHNLSYYLAFGTLLGAVRHKGYIPWDEDIDIMMPREDYEKFEREFSMNGKYKFLTHNNTKNYPYAFGKVIDPRTIKNEPIRQKYQVIGLDIDVFPIDNYPADHEEAEIWCAEIAKAQKSMHKLFYKYAKGKNILRTVVRNVIIAFNHIIDDLGICTVEKNVIKVEKLSQRYNSCNTGYCGIADIATYGVKKRNRIEVFKKKVEVEFEGYHFFAPERYDEYLTDVYGNYMQLPPVEKRNTHHTNIVYWK